MSFPKIATCNYEESNLCFVIKSLPRLQEILCQSSCKIYFFILIQQKENEKKKFNEWSRY